MRTAALALAALSLWQGCSAQTEVLKPVKPGDFGLRRRDTNTSTIGLQSSAQLLWLATTQTIFVNMTLQSGENELLLSTDEFTNELTSLTCTSDLSLTFNSNATFQAAIADWSWVFPEGKTFLMIVNYPGCTQNADNGRQLWTVSNIKNYDETNFVVDFEATLSEWATIGAAHSFSLDFGTSASNSSTIAPRKTFSKDESVSLSLAHDLPDSLYSKTLYGLDFSIDCQGCETTGTIDIVGHLEYTFNTLHWDKSGVSAFTLTATPKDVGIDLDLGLDVSGTLGKGWSDSVFVVPEIGLPGWSIPEIFTFGPQFSVEVGFQLSGVEGDVTIQAGMTAKIPDTATAVIDIHGSSSTYSGWEPTLSYTPASVAVEVDGSLDLYALMSLDLGATLLTKYSVGAGIFMKLPEVGLTLGAEYNSEGVCGGKDLYGVDFGATVGVDLDLGVYTQDGGAKTWRYNDTLYSNQDLINPISDCFSLGDTVAASATGVSISSTGTPIATTTAAKPTTAKKAISTKKSTSTKEPTSTKESASATSSAIVVATSSANSAHSSHTSTKTMNLSTGHSTHTHTPSTLATASVTKFSSATVLPTSLPVSVAATSSVNGTSNYNAKGRLARHAGIY